MNIIAADVHLTTHTPRDAQKQRASLNDETTKSTSCKFSRCATYGVIGEIN